MTSENNSDLSNIEGAQPSRGDHCAAERARRAACFFDVGGINRLNRRSGGSSQEAWAFENEGAVRHQLVMRRGPDRIKRPRPVAAVLGNEARLIRHAHPLLPAPIELDEAGKIRPYVSIRLPLAQAVEAIDLLALRRALGKVVVTIDSKGE